MNAGPRQRRQVRANTQQRQRSGHIHLWRSHIAWSFLALSVAIVVALYAGLHEKFVSPTSSSTGNSTSELSSGLGQPVKNEVQQPEVSVEAEAIPQVPEEGAFQDVQSMLTWAIGHADPSHLKQSAEDTRRLSAVDLEKKRADLKALLEELRMPTDAELMQTSLRDLRNETLGAPERMRALRELLELVETVDSANDFLKLGGFPPVIAELEHPDAEVQALAAWVLGKAAQNHALVQAELLQLEVLPVLMRLVLGEEQAVALKAFYAMSAIVRNHEAGEQAFYGGGGLALLQTVLSRRPEAGGAVALQQKALFLLADLAEQPGASALHTPSICSAVPYLVGDTLDVQEKAILAISSMARINKDMLRLLLEDCQTLVTLKELEVKLATVIDTGSSEAEYAHEVNKLREELLVMLTTTL